MMGRHCRRYGPDADFLPALYVTWFRIKPEAVETGGPEQIIDQGNPVDEAA